MTRIGIIGAGVSGRLLALNLIQHAPANAAIYLVDRRDPSDMGPAYSDDDDALLLNVPAVRMGAFAHDPEHFLDWLRARGVAAEPASFQPRRLFREYVLELLEDARSTRAAPLEFTHVHANVTDVVPATHAMTLHFDTARPPLQVDKVVLALGNFPPRDPVIATPATLQSARYVRDPWSTRALDGLDADGDVFLIGSSQTAVDVLALLHRRGHRGRIIAASRRGLMPLPHRRFDTYPSYINAIPDRTRVRSVLRTVRGHLEHAAASGIDIRAVIDTLRNDTQALWAGFPEVEKRRFLRHAFRHWEIIRSRLAPENQAIVDALRASCQLEVLACRIFDLTVSGGGIDVHYVQRGRHTASVRRVAMVVNCVGPELDYRRIDVALVRNLFRRKLIRSGPAELGIDATTAGAVIAEDGTASTQLYAIGPTMKGVLWEVIAVPDLRVQAERLARVITEATAQLR
jgi:uncharacterized NAD(P)/FAD-binding protein YdhS